MPTPMRATATPTPLSLPIATQLPSSTQRIEFDIANFLTYTPAPPALCPEFLSDAVPVPSFMDPEEPWTIYEEINEAIFNYLNLYGPHPIIEEYIANYQAEDHDPKFVLQDLTNDGIPEFVSRVFEFSIYGCQRGTYQNLLTLPPDGYFRTPTIVSIADENQNGMPELVLITHVWSAGGHEFQIYEWNGSEFDNLLPPEDPKELNTGAIYVDYNGRLEFQDTDGDSLDELIAISGTPHGLADIAFPFRSITSYYSWNGYQYEFVTEIMDPPEYRFQAVQDADQLSLAGEYDQALALYQEAIFSDELDWWSPEKREYLLAVWRGTDPGTPTPAPPITTTDYFELAAYSRFRIIVLHIRRGWISDARTVYDTLQAKFPEGQPGHIYAELATAFWDDFTATLDLSSACWEAMGFAISKRSEILPSLGSEHHGYQSQQYRPEDICPFR